MKPIPFIKYLKKQSHDNEPLNTKSTNLSFMPSAKSKLGSEKKPARTIWGIKHHVLIGFLILIVVIVSLLWVFQISLLNVFYRSIKTAEVKRSAETITRNLRLIDLDEMREKNRIIPDEKGIGYLVTDAKGNNIVGRRPSFRTLAIESFDRFDLIMLFEKTRIAGDSSFIDLDPNSNVYEDFDENSINKLVYITTPRIDGIDYLVMLEAEIRPVDSTVDTLKFQLFCLSIIMVVLGILLALIISNKISKPLSSINESAKQLANGTYNIHFPETGSKETRELAFTLNFAAMELSKVEALRRELLANVSHDLRTPLTMIKGYSEIMRDLPGENTPDNVQIIIDETERLTNLVNDLLDLSKLEASAHNLEKSTFNLTEEIRVMLTRYDKLVDYSFPFSYDKEVWVHADSLKISQVVYNLVNNAINYIGEDKIVQIKQTTDGTKVRISVTDTGRGIPADKLKDIWDRYYKVDSEHKRAQVGTGLGLSIVKNILDMHGGSYGVNSILELGSTFWFEVPICNPELPLEASDIGMALDESL